MKPPQVLESPLYNGTHKLKWSVESQFCQAFTTLKNKTYVQRGGGLDLGS